jgi:hypothetical protein
MCPQFKAVGKLRRDGGAVCQYVGYLTLGQPQAESDHQRKGEEKGERESIGHAVLRNAVRKWRIDKLGRIIWHRMQITSFGWTWK